MYGYVSINREALTEQELRRFRGYYCGLCRALKLRHGQTARLTLSYDMTVMYLLHSALYEPPGEEGEERCAAHVVRPHPYVFDSWAGYAADMSIILAWFKAQDDWQDERRISRLPLLKALAPAWKRVSSEWPDKCRLVGEAVAENDRIEAHPPINPDAAANQTGRIMGELYAARSDIWSETLRRMGHSLGRFIYLMDAYDDLKGDIRAGRPNPLIPMSSGENFRQEIEDILTLEMADVCAQFEKLPIVRDVSLLRNIYYSGVWCRFARMNAENGGKEKQT